MAAIGKDKMSVFINALLLLAFTYVWILLFFFPGYANMRFLLPNYLIFVISLLLLFFAAGSSAFKKPKPKSAKQENICLMAFSALLLGIQLFVSYNIIFRTSWDPGAVWYGAHYVSMNDAEGIKSMSGYFSVYPNNLLLVFIYSTIMTLNTAIGLNINGALLLVLFQCILLTLTGILAFRCAKRFVSSQAAWGVYALYAILAGLSGWMVIPYSDSSGIIFPILLFTFYLKLKESSTFARKLPYACLLAFTGYIGFQIKPMAAIVLIAIGLLEGAAWIPRILAKEYQGIKKAAVSVTAMLLSFALSIGIVSLLTDGMHFSINKESVLSWQHHMMLGANMDSRGGFSQEDFDFSTSFSDKKERNKAELQMFRDRLHDMGFKGYTELFARKAAKNYLNGTFGWGGVGESFYTEIYPMRSFKLCPVLRSLYYDDKEENLYKYHALFRQFVWLFIIAAVPFAAVPGKKLSDAEKVLKVSVLGLMLYLQIFEAHARYLFTFIPLFILLAAIGLENLGELIRRWGRKGHRPFN